MILNTSGFGEVEIDEDKIIRFPQGIPGFADSKRYIILDHPNGPDVPFKCLHSVDDADLAFVITDPLLFNCDYNPDLDEDDLKELDITSHLRLITHCSLLSTHCFLIHCFLLSQ